MRDPDVTIIIPTHNRSASLVRAMRSALSAGMDDVELLVVDDGSTDGTQQVVERFSDDRVRFHRLARRSGAPAARNIGIERARGRYLAFLDSDDMMVPGRLHRQMSAIRNTRRSVGSTGGFVVVGQGAPRHGFSTLGSRRQAQRLLRLRHGSLTSSVLMVSRDAAERTRWDEELPALQDYDFVLRLAHVGAIATVTDTLAVKERSDRRVFAGERVARARAMVLEKHRGSLHNDHVAMRRHCRALVHAVGARSAGLQLSDPEVFTTWRFALDFLNSHDSVLRTMGDSIRTERLIGRVADLLDKPPSLP